MIETICAPALIYICFSLTQIIIDMFKGLYNTAFFKFCIMIIFGLLLNILCERGLGIISWILVFVPFMLMSTITALLLFVFGLDPSTGKINKITNNQNKHHKHHKHNKHGKHHKHHKTASDSSDSSDSGESSDTESEGTHNSKLCKKMGCVLWDKTADGNCENLTDSTGKCYRQCYYGCDSSKGSCKYDSDCHLCPSQKISCNSNKKPANSGTTPVETFLSNMKKTSRY